MKLIVPAEEVDAVNWIEYLPSSDASQDRELPNDPVKSKITPDDIAPIAQGCN
jgi:hypothetical protein